ncbi:hypothetical protein SDC9_137880 [bioreactor metagenome]|uniref:Uncharacterized protein n=1 Tax=bioreactor metagenome TaxID=1076179 RepID=A0A645DNT3_9ZZZZ
MGGEGRYNRHQRQVMCPGKGLRQVFYGTADYRFVLVVSRSVIRDEHRDEKADDHPYAYYPCEGRDGAPGHLHAVASHLRGDDSLEDQPVSYRQRDVGALESKGEGTGDLTSVHIEFVEEEEEGRDQYGDERDMDWDHRSGYARDEGDEEHEHYLMFSHHRGDFFTGDRGQAGLVDRDGKCSEKEVGKRRLGVASHAADQNAHCRWNRHAGGQPPGERGEQQRKHDVQIDKA